ncbi:hypothetical protein [Methylosinus sp. sav-2]|uniref:hypothetical protein n=1 Tax=Methylosinus sp. sav-2 TaxID=2485168 RepID=UPI0012F6D4A3|nr:hypothetical protein [Methylosinus sp. sav-2]
MADGEKGVFVGQFAQNDDWSRICLAARGLPMSAALPVDGAWLDIAARRFRGGLGETSIVVGLRPRCALSGCCQRRRSNLQPPVCLAVLIDQGTDPGFSRRPRPDISKRRIDKNRLDAGLQAERARGGEHEAARAVVITKPQNHAAAIADLDPGLALDRRHDDDRAASGDFHASDLAEGKSPTEGAERDGANVILGKGGAFIAAAQCRFRPIGAKDRHVAAARLAMSADHGDATRLLERRASAYAGDGQQGSEGLAAHAGAGVAAATGDGDAKIARIGDAEIVGRRQSRRQSVVRGAKIEYGFHRAAPFTRVKHPAFGEAHRSDGAVRRSDEQAAIGVIDAHDGPHLLEQAAGFGIADTHRQADEATLGLSGFRVQAEGCATRLQQGAPAGLDAAQGIDRLRRLRGLAHRPSRFARPQ